MGTFTQSDPRGEYWLYSEDELRVEVGSGGIAGVRHFNTNDVHLQSGGPLESAKVAEILRDMMRKFGAEGGGYRNLVLHRDGKYDLTGDQIAQIDLVLLDLGFAPAIHEGKESRWSRE